MWSVSNVLDSNRGPGIEDLRSLQYKGGRHDNVECWENGTCIESKSTAPKCNPALEKELVQVYFAGCVAPELSNN
ncbi:hypothetical protein BDR04DRAFT_1111982, partial [Suillus decipiens]